MVKDPFFITKHHLTQVALNNGNCVLTRASDPTTYREEFSLLTEDEQEIKFTFLDLPFSLESPFWDQDHSTRYEAVYQVAGPCNGIVVISNAHDQLFLWNPATREYKAFPPASLSDSWAESNKLYRGGSKVGFGIDPITKDYKVVRVWQFVSEGFYIDKAEVLSLSANNSSCMWPKGGGESWKIIDDAAPAFVYDCLSNGGAYLNGKYYWYIESFVEGKYRIMWFDMGAEVFGLVELPNPLFYDPPIGGRLTTMLKEEELCLAMVRHAYKIEEENKHMYHIWIFVDDDEEGFSWTNYATAGPFSKMEVPLGFLGKNEELVVFKTCFAEREGDPVLESYVYNIKTRVKKKRMQGLDYDKSLPLTIYNESLVSVLGED